MSIDHKINNGKSPIKMQEKIKIISQTIHNRDKKTDFLEPYLKSLEELNIIDFISYNIKSFSDIYVFQLFMELAKHGILNKLTINDWKQILIKISNDVIPTIVVINFFYKYLKIDLITIIDSITEIPQQEKQKIKQFILERPKYLHYSKYDEMLLLDNGLKSNFFDHLSSRLINEGAPGIEREIIKFNTSDLTFNPITGDYMPKEDKDQSQNTNEHL